jgi:FeS assembly SUF system protein
MPGAGLEDCIVAALRTVFDPEIPVNIYDLGLIYGLDVGQDGAVAIRMTLTAPACPVAGMMPGLVESVVRKVDGVTGVGVELVWDPPWTRERMSDEARLQLGLL